MNVTATRKPNRLPALDFTKGALVLLMVLYHWLNYFYGFKHEFYRYLRFLTPSFIFITGFLISNVYLAKYKLADTRAPKRLLQRGLKILGIFTAINIAINFLIPAGRASFDILSVKGFAAIYVAGNILVPGSGKAAAFPVLVPISYLLLLSAGLLIVSKYWKYTFHAACGCFFLLVFILGYSGLSSGNLDLLAIGALGILLGYVPIESVNRLGKYRYALILAYLCYLGAITIWNVRYPLQVVGVCLTVVLLYLLGSQGDEPGGIRAHIILLGKYSLFGYIAQIAIVQLLHRGLWHFGFGSATLAVSFVGAFALTMLSVEAVDRARRKAMAVDKLYRVVFA